MYMGDNKLKPKVGIFSFFAGVGFLDLGFEETDGYKVYFANEYIQEFAEAYKYSREHMNLALPKYGFGVNSIEDYIKGGRANWLEKHLEKARKEVDLIGFIAGPPCPDFSVGGKNRGQTGHNGRLSTIYFDVIENHKPDFFLFENVKGLWRTKKHREFFELLKKRAHKNGYITTERLVNAREYGVPQDRDRIILIGIKEGIVGPEQINGKSLLEGAFPWQRNAMYKLADVKQTPWPQIGEFKENAQIPKPEFIKENLTVNYWFNKNDVENHPNSNDFFKPRAGLEKFQIIGEGDDKKKSYKRLHRWRYSPTCAYGNNEVHLHPYKARRISVSEALSLQSLPKEFVLPPSATLSGKFKMIGNGVPYLLSKTIAENLIYYLGSQHWSNKLEDDTYSRRISDSNSTATKEPAIFVRQSKYAD
jgi:DNA (cytosine-5)-methyltransferase 1